MANAYFFEERQIKLKQEYATLKAATKNTRKQNLEILAEQYDLQPKTILRLISESNYHKPMSKKDKKQVMQP